MCYLFVPRYYLCTYSIRLKDSVYLYDQLNYNYQ